MALTLETAREMYGDRFVKGLRLASVTVKIGATGDYSVVATAEGLNMEEVKPLLGYNAIVEVLKAVFKQSSGATRPYVAVFISETNRLRAFKGSAGALVEVVPGTDLAAGDLVQLTVIGG